MLLAHLLKWRFQPQLRTNSWRDTIDIQRQSTARRLDATPGLKTPLRDPDWQDDIWLDALRAAISETGLDRAVFPPASPWPIERALDPEFWPRRAQPTIAAAASASGKSMISICWSS